MADMWATISSERGALAEDLADVSTEQWASPSLCPEWTVQEALAHMTSTAHISPPSFLVGLAGSGFNFEKFSRKGIERWRGDSPAQTQPNAPSTSVYIGSGGGVGFSIGR